MVPGENSRTAKEPGRDCGGLPENLDYPPTMNMLRNLQASCPYCGERQRMEIDLTEGLPQEFVSDCTVCCRPIEVTVTSGAHGEPAMKLRSEDDTA